VVEPKKTKTTSERLQENTETIQNSIKRIKILEEFPFSGLQKLTSACQHLQEAKLVMVLNIGVLADVREFYEDLFEAAEFPPGIKKYHATELQTFLRRIRCSEKKLSTQCTRVDALIHITNDGKNLVCLFPFSVLVRSSLILESSITRFSSAKAQKRVLYSLWMPLEPR
jgi:hypothetical protein